MKLQYDQIDNLHGRRKLASDLLAQNVLRTLAAPAYYFDGGLLEQTAREQGGFAVMVPARRQPFQLPMSLAAFFGITCSKTTTKVTISIHTKWKFI